MSSERHSAPPVNTLERLAADLVAVRATTLLNELAHAGWDAAVKLQQAVDCYNELRSGNLLKDASDPQRCTVADWPQAPETERSAPDR